MGLVENIKQAAVNAIKDIFQHDFPERDMLVNVTKPEFEGDYTVVVFPFTRFSRKSPEDTGKLIGGHLLSHGGGLFVKYNVEKGFLNLTISDQYWIDFLALNGQNKRFGFRDPRRGKVMVEYSSPNTNKPLHLGHLRNNFLGASISAILEANGYEVIQANLVNDRGIHICKSMIAWQMFGNGATPQSTGIKGDHLVGDYYVKFNEEYKRQVEEMKDKGMSEAEAGKEAPVMKAAQEMLLQWEQHDPGVRQLWATMNGWVYEGFETTYNRLGIHFDKFYYESETYLLGKHVVEEGLLKKVFFKKEDGSVWIDLTGDGLDEKLLLRGDGTSVYITQDLGTAQLKYDDYHMDQSIYVIADEQNYHMKVLKLILEKMGKPYASGIYHLSYGMVELPGGRMKSREGTVVDADDMVDEMIATAARHTSELGKVKDFSEAELQRLYEVIGLGAMKFFLLRVDPKKRMIFNPEESIDFHGFTGSFIQYTYARIRSILRKEGMGEMPAPQLPAQRQPLLPLEKELIFCLEQYEGIIGTAGAEMNPSVIANYVYALAKVFNSFYAEHSVSKAETAEKKLLRLQLCIFVANTIYSGMKLLGINVPERM